MSTMPFGSACLAEDGSSSTLLIAFVAMLHKLMICAIVIIFAACIDSHINVNYTQLPKRENIVGAIIAVIGRVYYTFYRRILAFMESGEGGSPNLN